MENDNSEPRSPIQPRTKTGSCVWVPILLLALIIGGGYYFYTNFLQNPCGTPVHFAIGSVDSRFKISKSEVQSVAEDASSRWDMTSSGPLLEYDPSASLKINLVYDDRQAKVDEINGRLGTLSTSGNAINNSRAKLQDEISQYKNDLDAYNTEVEKWNASGGATVSEYSKLQSEKTQLDKRHQSINDSASLLNEQINQQNSNIDQLNTQLEEDRNTIVTEGLYYTIEKKIDIFTFGNKEELRLVLMHELGHALSLEHDSAATSIMYPILGKQDLSNPEPSSEDLNVYSSTCQTWQGRLKTFWQNLINKNTIQSTS